MAGMRQSKNVQGHRHMEGLCAGCSKFTRDLRGLWMDCPCGCGHNFFALVCRRCRKMPRPELAKLAVKNFDHQQQRVNFS